MPADPGSDETIFAAALQWETPAQRAAYLEEACAGQPALRARVEALLQASDAAQTFLERPVGGPRPTPGESAATVKVGFSELLPATEGPGTKIGRYKLLQQIGEGGCGTVFMAEQEEPVRRRVALKVIKLGMDTKSVIARFEAERQALALMDHPNIARVLDAGATDSGRPFFVMELVRGIPITRYCDENKLDTQARLDLFIKVCQAIQHAHQKGIIHRDIKPSNILVTLHDGVPVPKVIDFGIAKATEGRLTNQTLFTAFEQFIGTPAYMSPEQAEMSGLDIDTRSDIYALGVLLYELLTGKTPFDAKELAQSGIDAMRKTIREKEPLRPSTRLTQAIVAAEVTRRTAGNDEPSASSRRRLQELVNLIRGDLDWIVMKCLEKDRTRRYETANGLASDIQRHLRNEPVLARPPSAAYKFQKAFRRNKLVFVAGGVVANGLLIAVSALAFALIRERSLKSESARADSVAAFATTLLDDSLPKFLREGNVTAVRTVLESADRLASRMLTNSPAAELTVRYALMMYGFQSDNHQAQVGRIESLLPQVSDDRLPPGQTRQNLQVEIAWARMAGGAVDQGRSQLESLINELRRQGPAANIALANAAGSLGEQLLRLNRPLEAERYLEEAHQLDMIWGRGYAEALILNGKHHRAEQVAHATFNRSHEAAEGHPVWKAALARLENLGEVYAASQLVRAQCLQGKFGEADAVLAKQLENRGSPPWSPTQLKNIRTMQLGVKAYSGRWQEALAELVRSAANPEAALAELTQGMVAAYALGDTAAYGQLDRRARLRYLADAHPDDAGQLFEAVILQPRSEDLSSTLPELLTRMDDRKGFNSYVPLIPFLKAQLAYRSGGYEEALSTLDSWLHSQSERPLDALVLDGWQSLPMPEFWRAMILARLGRGEAASQAYYDGVKRIPAGFRTGDPLGAIILSKAMQREALQVLRSQGIAISDTGTTP